MALWGDRKFVVGDSVILTCGDIFSPSGTRIPCGSDGEIIHRCDDGSLLVKFAGALGHGVVYPRQLRMVPAREVGQACMSTAHLQAQAGPSSRRLDGHMPLSALRQPMIDDATPLRNLARQDRNLARQDDAMPLRSLAGGLRALVRQRSRSSGSTSSTDSSTGSDNQQLAAQKLEAEDSDEAASRVASMDADKAAEIVAEMQECRAAEMIENITDNNKAAKILSELDVHKAGEVVRFVCEFKAADILAEMESERAAEVMSVMDASTVSRVLSNMDDEDKAAQVLNQTDSDEASQILDLMDNYKRADILLQMDPHKTADILTKMDEHAAAEVLTSVGWTGPSVADVLSEMDSEKAAALAHRVHDEDCCALEDVLSDMDSDKAADILSRMEDTLLICYMQEDDLTKRGETKDDKFAKILANPKLSVAKIAALFSHDAADALAKMDAKKADAIRHHMMARHILEYMVDEAPDLLAKMEDVRKAAAMLETIESIGGDQAMSIVRRLGEKRNAILHAAGDHKRRRTA